MTGIRRTLAFTLLSIVLHTWAILLLCAQKTSGPTKPASGAPARKTRSGVTVAHADFHGWNAIVLRNANTEVTVVPVIGRVMEFNLLDGKAVPGPFWNNPAIGKQLQPDSEGWTNYGGDKAWPSPQSEWPKVTGSGWPPPKGFDAMPYTASIQGDKVELVSAVDPAYGVRVRRSIALDAKRAAMTIETRYEKVQGGPVRVGIWTITQLASPDRVFMLLPQQSKFSQGYRSFLPAPPKNLKVDGRLLSLTRDSENKTMIGNDSTALLWVGDGPDLLIENTSSPSTDGAEWPDNGSHAKIYTNSGDELKYVELELLSPLHDLKPGETVSMKNTYSLIRRTKRDPVAEARKVLAHR